MLLVVMVCTKLAQEITKFFFWETHPAELKPLLSV